MRIGVDIKTFSHNSTGIARYLRELLDSLQISDQKNEYFLFECRLTGYKIRNARWQKITSRWFLPGILWQQLVLPFLLNKHRIDVFWAPEQICPIFCMKKIKIITTVHDCVAVHYPHSSQWSVYVINKLLLGPTLSISNRLITVSNFIRSDVLKSFTPAISPHKVVAIPNGKPSWILPPDYTPESRGDYLFFAGNTEPRKNLLNAIKALELLFDKKISIKLYIAGPLGWKNKTVMSYMHHSRIGNNIRFLGFCDDTALISHYLHCKAFLFPSLYEGFGLPVLEALCLDCLVLTSQGTAMEEILGPAALYFNPTNPHSIAKSIETVFSSGFNRSSVLKHKEAVLKNYSWEHSARRLLAVLCEKSGPT